MSNPFAELEKAAQRQEQEEKAARSIKAARTTLILGTDPKSAFFADLTLRLEPEVDWTCDTAWTDGKKMGYNPAYVASLSQDEVNGLNIHETLHPAFLHHARREGRDPEKWNIACDLAINPIVAEMGFKLPAGALFPGRDKYRHLPAGKCAEEYYPLLQQSPRPDGQQGQPGQPSNQPGQPGNQPGQNSNQPGGQGDASPGADPGKCGEVRDAGDHAQNADSAADWQAAVVRAELSARCRGDLPGGLKRFVAESVKVKTDWRDVLREFVRQRARNRLSWAKPNKRHVHRGIYLPGRSGRKLGEVLIAIDTSGSISQKDLATFSSEVQDILQTHQCSATIYYHDTMVVHTQTWEPSDGDLVLEPKGGGGTSHRDVFARVERDDLEPVCVICLTDLATVFPESSALPTLWAVIGGCQTQPPFGQVVYLD